MEHHYKNSPSNILSNAGSSPFRSHSHVAARGFLVLSHCLSCQCRIRTWAYKLSATIALPLLTIRSSTSPPHQLGWWLRRSMFSARSCGAPSSPVTQCHDLFLFKLLMDAASSARDQGLQLSSSLCNNQVTRWMGPREFIWLM